MKEYIPLISAITAGIFATLAAILAWKLKSSTDSRERTHKKNEELKTLYTNTFQLFEEAMRQTIHFEEYTLAQKFSENNAKINLLAPTPVVEKYLSAADLLESWSVLHVKASPKRTMVGDQVVITFQAPDPTAKYKEPANNEYKKLHEAIQSLVELMRNEVSKFA
jgi:hypothetical protein